MRTRRFNQYHPQNPKIDVFRDGLYLCSTNWFSNVRDVVKVYSQWNPGNRITAHKAK